MKHKRIILATTITLLSTFVMGCSNSTETTGDTSTTNNAQVTTNETTTEEPSTEYVYKGEDFRIATVYAEYFNGLVLNTGDKLYLNDIIPGKDEEANFTRGNIAITVFTNFEMTDELIDFQDKYMVDGAYSPEVHFEDNYFIEYSGQNVKLTLVKSDDILTYYDMVPVE